MAKPPRTARRSRPGRLRIVAGKWRRRLLPVADVPGLRPTAERVRETVFNWLEPRIEGARCLDVCAGTGALGFEALSRGAREAVMLEESSVAVRALVAAAASLDAGNATILRANATHWLGRETPEPFDIVFLDPPYGADLLPELCRLLATRGWLAADARVYLELDRAAPEPEFLPGNWERLKDRSASHVRYLLLAARPQEEGDPG